MLRRWSPGGKLAQKDEGERKRDATRSLENTLVEKEEEKGEHTSSGDEHEGRREGSAEEMVIPKGGWARVPGERVK